MSAEQTPRDASESSGLADILAIAANLETEGVVTTDDSSTDADDAATTDPPADGYGTVPAAVVVPAIDDDVSEGTRKPASAEPERRSVATDVTAAKPPADHDVETVPASAPSAEGAKPARRATIGLLLLSVVALAVVVWAGLASKGDEDATKTAAVVTDRAYPEPAVVVESPASVAPKPVAPQPPLADDPPSPLSGPSDADNDALDTSPQPQPSHAAAKQPGDAPTRPSKRPARGEPADVEPEPAPAAVPPEPAPEPAPAVEPEVPAVEPVPTPEPAPQPIDDKFSSDCLLNPDKPGCSEAKQQEQDVPDVTASLPDKLTQIDIRNGIGAVKSNAKACGAKFGAASGTVVRVKLSIEGSSGKIVSATPMDPHAGQPVGKCVADALMKATFPRFKTRQQGTVYPVIL